MKIWNLFLLVGLLSFIACSDDEDDTLAPMEDPKTIVDLAVETSDLSSLVAALERADLVATLNGSDDFTVFAPTNDAFNTFLAANGFASVDEVPVDVLTQILLNHVVSGTTTSSQLSTGYISSLATREFDPISMYINTDNGVQINNVSSVSTADVTASNGVVHIVDAVIGLPNVVTFATADNTFSTLVAALTRSDVSSVYVDLLIADGPYTIFAPTNDAFSALLAGLGFSSLDEVPVEVLTAVLDYHVIAGANVRSTALSDDQIVTTFQGEDITIDLDGGAGIIDATGMKTNIIATDVQGINGVIHAIEGVLLPQEAIDIVNPAIVGIVASNPDFSILAEAATRADLLGVLGGDSDLTVFAPTNDAFDAFLTANGFGSINDVPVDVLTQVLLNHVVTGNVLSTDLATGYVKTNATESTTSNFIDLYVDLSNGVSLNGQSQVTTADVGARNGTIHIVDSVIALPTVVTFATTNPVFNTLVAALTRSDLTTDFVGTLSGNGPFTVFAPTNDAFSDLLTELNLSSLADIEVGTLDSVLKYHVVNGSNVLSSALSDDMDVTTFGGSNFIIDLDNGPEVVDLNNRRTQIIITDVQSANGVVHVVNRVLLPNL